VTIEERGVVGIILVQNTVKLTASLQAKE